MVCGRKPNARVMRKNSEVPSGVRKVNERYIPVRECRMTKTQMWRLYFRLNGVKANCYLYRTGISLSAWERERMVEVHA